MLASLLREHGLEAVAQGGLPGLVDPRHVDGSDLVMLPALEGVHQRAGMAGMHAAALHRHLARAHQCLGRQPHGGQLAVGAVLARLLNGRDDKLVEEGALRRGRLLLGAERGAHHPGLAPRALGQGGGVHQKLLGRRRGLVAHRREALRRLGVHNHARPSSAEVQRDGAAELAGGACEEDFLNVAGQLLEDGSGGERVAVHHANLQLPLR
mmetsp:Transcript_25058/g.65046  ORF Transcript_25058/g.65046 Transcript_25058/m.65046 type:complete len:210 (-) Transcript_25058:159-788(-)